MTKRYNHLEASQITDVMKAQAVIAGTQKTEKQPKETENAKRKKHRLTLVKIPNRKSA